MQLEDKEYLELKKQTLRLVNFMLAVSIITAALMVVYRLGQLLLG